MEKKDADLFVLQIRSMLLNKPITDDLVCNSKELLELQSAMYYLENTFSEANMFLKEIAQGNFDTPTPSKHNLIASNLKELHANLKHLTWLANQVANGDYNQRVSFLGDFSKAFNEMITQLSEREAELKEQALILEESAKLLRSVMDGIKDWIIVTSKIDGEILYLNDSAKDLIEGDCNAILDENKKKMLLEYLKSYHLEKKHNGLHELVFNDPFLVLNIKTYAIRWNDTLANVHYFSDITFEKEILDSMEKKAYKDELTNIYNRHYLKEKMNKLIDMKVNFTFCMIDIDGLKFANDNFGHNAGDGYLKNVATTLATVFDKEDIVCRIGGDEFAVISTDKKCEAVTEYVKKADEDLMNRKLDFPMSISYGVIDVDCKEHCTEEDIISRADEKMYTFKKLRKKENLN